MEITALFLAIAVGFAHAFEADHLVAVSSIVTRRNNMTLAIKDGVFWGFGHTATILLVGLVFLLGKFILPEQVFTYFEAGVGLMLVGLGIARLLKLFRSSADTLHTHAQDHGLAFGVGLVHGLAGSGVLVLSVISTTESASWGLAYLTVFGLGSIFGMTVAAGAFSIPFSDRILKKAEVRQALTLLSALLCIGLGAWVMYENLA